MEKRPGQVLWITAKQNPPSCLGGYVLRQHRPVVLSVVFVRVREGNFHRLMVMRTLRIVQQEAHMALLARSSPFVITQFLVIWAIISASVAIGFALGRLTLSL